MESGFSYTLSLTEQEDTYLLSFFSVGMLQIHRKDEKKKTQKYAYINEAVKAVKSLPGTKFPL